jgi:hypothetical protein
MYLTQGGDMASAEEAKKNGWKLINGEWVHPEMIAFDDEQRRKDNNFRKNHVLFSELDTVCRDDVKQNGHRFDLKHSDGSDQ